jgi:DNA/RNA-binding domain of Phe-tRNA-synthetase-like protein
MIKISKDIKVKIENFKVGIITYKNITVDKTPQMLIGRLQLFQESLMFDLETKPVSQFAGIQEWRTIFKKIGTDPSKYRPSIEALYRRIKNGNLIISKQSAVDVNNFFSLQYEIPFGIYDEDKIKGDISINIGTEDSEYDAVNGRLISFNKKLVCEDALGAFGSPFVDSKRTMVTEKTKNAVQIVYLKPSMSKDEATHLLNAAQKMFVQVHGGETDTVTIIE